MVFRQRPIPQNDHTFFFYLNGNKDGLRVKKSWFSAIFLPSRVKISLCGMEQVQQSSHQENYVADIPGTFRNTFDRFFL